MKQCPKCESAQIVEAQDNQASCKSCGYHGPLEEFEKQPEHPSHTTR